MWQELMLREAILEMGVKEGSLKRKKNPAMFDFFPPLMSLFPHNGKKTSLNLREEE